MSKIKFYKKNTSFNRLFRKILIKPYLAITKILRLKRSEIIDVIDDSSVSEIIFSVKDSTIEEIPFMNVFEHICGGKIKIYLPAIYLRKYNQATIYPSSDFIRLNNKVVWHKTKYPHFGKVIPLDDILVRNNKLVLNLDKPKREIIIENGFSLCGVHSNVWSHFLVQYLPKIDSIRKIIEITGERLTVIVPQYNDHNIQEILNKLVSDISLVDIIVLKVGEVAKCKNLYYVENTTILSDHASYLSPTDCVIPKFVTSYLKNTLLTNKLLFPSLSENNRKPPFRKLYIRRAVSQLSPLSNSRILENSIEIEKFFENEGFEFITPHKYTLDEKRKLFSEASFIAGSYSSGFMNMIFCQPETKILVFMNYQRIYELYLANLAGTFDLNLLALTGTDLNPNDIHSSYNIPLEKVIISYKKILNQ